MISLALYCPEIPHNTGALIRLGACYGMPLHIIGPTGFVWSHRHLRRSGLDYREIAEVTRHDDFECFMSSCGGRRLILADVKGQGSCYDFRFEDGDVLIMGRESTGVPDEVAGRLPLQVHIPMRPEARSLNMAMAAAIITSEMRRQLRF